MIVQLPHLEHRIWLCFNLKLENAFLFQNQETLWYLDKSDSVEAAPG
jgi:hypothetical protein